MQDGRTVKIGHNTAGCARLEMIDGEYCPYNKRRFEVKATGTLKITHYDGTCNNHEPWIEFHSTEMVRTKNGNYREKVISLYLHGDEIAKLREMLDMPMAEADIHRPLGV